MLDDVIETAESFRCIDMIIDHAKAADGEIHQTYLDFEE